MNTNEQSKLVAATFDSPNDMLRKLVERQGLELKRVNALNDELYAANVKLSTELLAASEERKQVLAMLQSNVQELRRATERLVKERDMVEQALRQLVPMLDRQPPSSLNYFLGAPLVKAVREAAELLKVIDALKRPPTAPS